MPRWGGQCKHLLAARLADRLGGAAAQDRTPKSEDTLVARLCGYDYGR